jgi:hypothetical protein
MARRLAYTRALHECPEEVAKDLQQAGWIKYLCRRGSQHIWRDLEFAMLEEISRWIWGCKRGRGTNRALTIKQPLDAPDPIPFRYDSANLRGPTQVIREKLFDGLTPERYLLIKEDYEEARKDKRKFPMREYKRMTPDEAEQLTKIIKELPALLDTMREIRDSLRTENFRLKATIAELNAARAELNAAKEK